MSGFSRRLYSIGFVIDEGLKVAYDCLHPLHTDLNSGETYVTGCEKYSNKQTNNQSIYNKKRKNRHKRHIKTNNNTRKVF